MERRPEIGFISYDRLFPNQDSMPAGGFGNLRDKGRIIAAAAACASPSIIVAIVPGTMLIKKNPIPIEVINEPAAVREASEHRRHRDGKRETYGFFADFIR